MTKIDYSIVFVVNETMKRNQENSDAAPNLDQKVIYVDFKKKSMS